MNSCKLNESGDRCYNEQNYTKAFEYYQLSASKNNASAQNNIGWCYAHGKGVEQDYKKAFEYYQLSANQNNASAQNNIGYCYDYGRGIIQDYKKAFEYYQLSANQNTASAQNNIGWCYTNGQGVKQDYKKALEYFQLCDNQHCITNTERDILARFKTSLSEKDYVYAYPLYVKHNYDGLVSLKKLLNNKYTEIIDFLPQVLNNLIILYLL